LSNFNTIQSKLEQFIKRYYVNELIKGAILFFAAGLMYFILTLLIEYFLWLNTGLRTLLFWLFVVVEIALLAKFIVWPLLKLFKLQKGIDYEQASKIIGSHFPEVNDKLLNVLQLKSQPKESELLLASINQKSAELSPVPFHFAINFKNNTRYLKYAIIPLMIVLLSYATGKFNWFSDSYERVVNYKTAYEPPAPFQFFVLNESLNALESKPFTVKVNTVGDLVPENPQIHLNGSSYFLKQLAPGEFEFTINQPKTDTNFYFSANDVQSKNYELSVVNVPVLTGFEMILDYPLHTNKPSETIKSTGNAVIPEGTKVTWLLKTKATDAVNLYATDTLFFKQNNATNFSAEKRVFKNLDYNISISNNNLKDYESLAFSLKVVKDAFPEINLKHEIDSLDGQSLYFYGQVSDDYGLRKLQLVYYPSGEENNKTIEPINVGSSNFSEFVSAFPNQLQIEPGISYELYFEVFDNDAVNNFKSAKSSTFTYRKRTQDEEEDKQLQQQNETIKGLNQSFEKLQEQDKKLEEITKTQIEKDQLNFNDKKKLEEFLKRQAQQEQMMQNFNEKLQKNLEEFQQDNQEKDPFKESLQERLKENENKLKQDEQLLKELEELKDKINKEEFNQKLEELAKQNQNKKRSLQQLLELTKRFYVSKKQEKLAKDLEKLAKEQESLSDKPNEENNPEKQKELNKAFEEFQKQMEELIKENEQLKQPMPIEQNKPEEESIKQDQQDAQENLEQQQEQQEKGEQQDAQQSGEKAKQQQKKAAKKMKQMAQQMMQSMQMAGGEQMSEDIRVLRQILDNVVLFSFSQEDLMERFRGIETNHNNYGKFVVNQKNLREHFEHVDDSLFALSLRQPALSEEINKQITDVYFNIDKSLDALSENQIYQGVASQQYTVTATNNLANFLSDALDNMESQMNASGSGKGQDQGEPLPDIIMSQEELNKMMEEGLKESEKGKPDKGEDGKEGEEDDSKEGENGNEGEQGEGKQNGQGEGEEMNGNEEMNGKLFEIYQQQQKLRKALEDKIGKDGNSGKISELIEQMEEVELDLINKGFTNQTLQKMMALKYELLKLENATFQQGEDDKRESKTNRNTFNNSSTNQIPTAREYFNTTEILNRQALPLREFYKKRVQDYFKRND
jgi:hypothetical protein